MVKFTSDDLSSLVGLDKGTCSGFLRYLERRNLVKVESRKPAGGKGRNIRVYVFDDETPQKVHGEIKSIQEKTKNAENSSEPAQVEIVSSNLESPEEAESA